MTQGKYVELSVAQRTDVWRRWKAGESLNTIGRAFDRPHTSIHCLLAHHGGIIPAVRRRALLTLTAIEREDISRGLASGSSLRDIAKRLERAASTVSREVARHGGRPEYRAHEADQRAWDAALRPKRCLLAIHVKLQRIVASKLFLDWSPEQISGWLKIRYPDDESMRVSHETIYRSLFIQARGVLKKELLGHLRSKRRIRRSRHARIFKDSRGQIVDAISIRERPAEIEDRAVPGHWEGDLIGGTKNSHIATLVERHSRFTAQPNNRSVRCFPPATTRARIPSRASTAMSNVDSLNALARRIWTALIAAHPEWAEFFGTCGKDDLEVAISAPVGSNAGHLVVFTAKGRDLWIRFSPPSMCYSVDDETELLSVIQQLLAETALFAVVMRGDEWAGTTLIRRGEPRDVPQLGSNEVAHVVSWSGKYDQTIKSDAQA
jgi:IS30 family transposase